MSPQTVKLVLMLFLAMALLNITNYLFYLLYDPPSHHAMKSDWKTIVTKKFTTKRRRVHTIKWPAFLLAKDPDVTPSPINELKTDNIDGDYRDQSSVVSHLYEYNKGLDKCPQKPPGLGPINYTEIMSLEEVEKLYETLLLGGVYEETECTARQSVAIIIPHRGRKDELLKFLYTLHPFLMKQQLDYQIFVTQQSSDSPTLNRSMMLNAGFSEAQRMQQAKKDEGWSCVVFHELDLLPTDTRNLYRCSANPHQLITIVNNRSYEYQFGGAIAINPSQFNKVNGFSNLYSGNEAVYDDLYKRFLNANYTLTRSNTFGKYLQPKHSVDANQTRFQTIQTASPLNLIDGLSTLNYKVKFLENKQLYTLIGVDIQTPVTGNTTEKVWNRLLSQATAITTVKLTNAKVIQNK